MILRLSLALCLLLSVTGNLAAGPVPIAKPANYPDWWFTNDVVVQLSTAVDPAHPVWPTDYPPPDDYAAVNIGQLKQMVAKARHHIGDNLGNTYFNAYGQINLDFLRFGSNSPARDDYAALNLGQLKYVSAPYYELLASLGYGGQSYTYPWTAQIGDEADNALVTIGQLKRVFSFELGADSLDCDADGLPDAWERKYFTAGNMLPLRAKPWEDSDSDGATNLAEYQADSHPFKNPALWLPGTLGHACNLAIDVRITGKNPTVAMPLYTVKNHTSSPPQYTRNPNNWCVAQSGLPAVDLTCISPYNTSSGSSLGATLITPRHVIMCAHSPLSVPCTIRFVSMDGTMVDRQMVSTKIHANYNSSTLAADVMVGLLDQEVPSYISFCKVLPPTYSSYINAALLSPSGGVLALGLNQFEEASVSELATLVPAGVNYAYQPAADAQRNLFFWNKISGDSGNPVFLIINNQLTLLNVWSSGGPGSGTNIAEYASDINQMIASLDSDAGITQPYALTVQDLALYHLYP